MFIALMDCDKYESSYVGNKARNLSILLKISQKCNFKVPDGFVLDSSISNFMSVLESVFFAKLKDWGISLEMLKERKYDPTGEVKWHVAKEMQDKIKELCEEKIREIVPKIIAEVRKYDWCYFYIRSSSNIADAKEKTYAGAFRSLPMKVEKMKEESLLECLLSIYKSVFSLEALVQYLYNNEEISKIRLALIFQKLKDKTAIFSGVVQTKIPSNEGIHISCAQGLGNTSMVHQLLYPLLPEYLSDLITREEEKLGTFIEVDVCYPNFYVNESTKIKREQKFRAEVDVEKGWGIRLTPIERQIEFNNDLAIAIARICKCVEKEFNYPLFVEFAIFDAIDKPTVQIVQARPIPGY